MMRSRRPPVVLTTNEVHVWLVELNQPRERLVGLAQTLTAEERERAVRFRFPEHRDQFTAGRGLLRELLGAYLNRPAAALRFSYGSRGKPRLGGADADIGLYFNLAHSGDRALYVVAYREVGVDLERLDRVVNETAVAERICTPREWMAFQALSDERLRGGFFMNCWTRKEAIVKAFGGGLAYGLQHLEVCFPENLLPDGRVGLRDALGREWSVMNLPLDNGWSGAVAAEGTSWRWRGWRWS